MTQLVRMVKNVLISDLIFLHSSTSCLCGDIENSLKSILRIQTLGWEETRKREIRVFLFWCMPV